jgi:site-specific DNA-methyltransferase (adenine-specific)
MQRILTGDCRTILPTLDAASFDACVCDPPYDLTDVGRRFPGTGGTLRPDGGIRSESRHGGFMGKEWDATGVAFDPATWEAVRRVLKPGGVLMAFGGTRTWHRLAVAVEDAGFVIFDTLMWLYGSGFPKHKTLLKPAFEPIILAKKLGAGGLHTEAGRLGYSPDDPRLDWIDKYAGRDYGKADNEIYAPMNSKTGGTTLGRWPANVALDEAAARLLDEQSGERTSGKAGPDGHKRNAREPIGIYGNGRGLWEEEGPAGNLYGDSGGASRFYYCSKASRRDRNEGLEGMPERASGVMQDDAYRWEHDGKGNKINLATANANHHPTVKPTDLMRWLCRLITPPRGGILDPFMGSGSTGKACVLEGFGFVGIDRESEYVEIARRRIEAARADMPLFNASEPA